MNFEQLKSVVVHTTSNAMNRFPIGYITDAGERGMVVGLGGVCLPVADVAVGDQPCFSRIDLGRGLDLTKQNSRLAGVLPLYLTSEYRHIHYAFGLAKAPTVDMQVLNGGRAEHPGHLSLGCRTQTDTGMHASTRGLQGAINPQDFGSDEAWYDVAGSLEVSAVRSGWYEFGLHGTSAGVLLMWMAISATK